MFFKSLKYYLLSFFIFMFISCCFIPTLDSLILNKDTKTIIEYYTISNTEFCWPIPGYTRISSNFGKRNSPTSGASSFHLGIDIPAPQGTNLVSPCKATVIFTGFKRFRWLHNYFKV